MTTLGDVGKKWLNRGLDLLFPRACFGCQVKGVWICDNCLDQARHVPVESDQVDVVETLSVFAYHQPVIKTAIWQLKYQKVRNIAALFGQLLYERVIEELSDWASYHHSDQKFLVLPIPISSGRKRHRGFNQAAEIAKHFCAQDKSLFTYLPDGLIKNRETKAQALITNRRERLQNIVGSFAVRHPAKIKGAHVIVIDDVTTTGATLREAKKVLKSSGAKRIILTAVAHG